ncbi:MAG TPA: TlpA disulfide reductase family protein [Vicinamibacterales bacterium]|nr:TlpA disulfide reductase family protein [Vicinamibacterales bacterium]
MNATILVVALTLPSPAAAADRLKPFKLKTLDGVEQTLAQVSGAKATLVVFFFPTCPYCNAEFPFVQQWYDTYKAHGLNIVWINVVPDEQKLIRIWQKQHGYTVPILLGRDSTPGDYKVRTTPTQYLLNANGETVLRKDAYYAGDEKAMEQEIRRALGL